MPRSKIATALTLAVFAATIWAQAASAQANAQDHEAHHPDGAKPAQSPPSPAPPTTGQQQQGMMGGMNMMTMMGNMPEMMRMMGMMERGMGGMATIDRVEGRIAFLRAELKITDAQANAWNTFADALRTNAQKLAAVRPAMMMPQPGSGVQQQTLADRLDAQERWLAARLEGTRAIKTAFAPLYAALSDYQKKTANELLAPHMGMRMMSGQMGPAQMGPGQMTPR